MAHNVVKALAFFLAVLLFGSALPEAEAHPGYYGTAFHAHDLAGAKVLAQREHKLILAYVSDVDGKMMPLFRWRTQANQVLADLLIREAVITELSVEKNADELAAYTVIAPQYVLLDAQGKLLKTIDADLLAAQMVQELTPYFTGEGAVARARASVADNGPEHFFSRERLATALRSVGRHQEALSEYAWCLEQIAAESSKAATSRASHIYTALNEYAEVNADAAALLDASLDAAEVQIMAAPNDKKLARRVAGSLARQQKIDRAKALFDKLGEDSRAKHAMLDLLMEELLADARYDEVLQLIKPSEAVDGEIELYKRMKVQRPAWAEQGTGRGTRSFVVKRSLAVIEALSGSGDEEAAAELIAKLRAFDEQQDTKDALEKALLKTGNAHLLNTEPAAQ